MNYKVLTLALIACLNGFSQTAIAKSKAELPLDEIRNFVDVYNTIRNEYVDEKDGKTLIDFAIEGMLDGLDPYSIYLSKEQLSDVKDDVDGSYQGFGIQIELLDEKLTIIAPIPGGPADKAGIKTHDQILKINGTVIGNLSMSDVSQLLKSLDSVTLTIVRQKEKPQEFKLVKSKVNIPSISQKRLDKNYGYIRINQFQADTAIQFNDALNKLLDISIKGLVVDLRNNPGGLINTATDIADSFLDAGLIVSTKNQNTGSEDKIHATKNTIAKDLPLVVLINEGSASASELLAGALQSHKRALIVGQQSFGKGSVQSVMPLANGSALKLTIARYYTPSGESIQATGIKPDILLSQLKVDEKEKELLSYGEANVPKHLQKDHSAESDDVSDQSKSAKENIALAKSDLQLFEALNVLKVLVYKQ